MLQVYEYALHRLVSNPVQCIDKEMHSIYFANRKNIINWASEYSDVWSLPPISLTASEYILNIEEVRNNSIDY